MRIFSIPSLPLALLLVWSQCTHAAQWSVEPTVSLRSGYNDNYRLTTGPHDSVWEEDLTPAVKFGVETENQGLFGTADTSVRRFYGGSGSTSSSTLDREDYHFKVDSYQQSQLNRYGANIDFIRDSTLDTELTQTGQVVDNLATRTSTELNPTWTRSLDERTQLDLGYTFNRVNYSDVVGLTNLVNYDFNTVSASLTRQFTPLTQATLATSVSRYLPETNLNSDSYAIQAGLTRQHSETLSTNWLAGWRTTKSDTSVPTGFCVGAAPGASFPNCTGGFPVQTGANTDQVSNSGAVYAAGITKTLETGSVGASLSRIATPSGNGQLLDTTQFTLTGEYYFTEHLRSNMTATYYTQDQIVNASGTQNFSANTGNFFRVIPRLTWQWRREWSLQGEYQFAKDDNANGTTAKQNSVYLTLIYQPTKMFISR
jgi:hypothetical protein